MSQKHRPRPAPAGAGRPFAPRTTRSRALARWHALEKRRRTYSTPRPALSWTRVRGTLPGAFEPAARRGLVEPRWLAMNYEIASHVTIGDWP